MNLKQRCHTLVFVAETVRMRTRIVRSCFIVVARVFNHSLNDNFAMSFEKDLRIDGTDGLVFSRVPRAAWEFVLAFNSPECPCPEHQCLSGVPRGWVPGRRVAEGDSSPISERVVDQPSELLDAADRDPSRAQHRLRSQSKVDQNDGSKTG